MENFRQLTTLALPEVGLGLEYNCKGNYNNFLFNPNDTFRIYIDKKGKKIPDKFN